MVTRQRPGRTIGKALETAKRDQNVLTKSLVAELGVVMAGAFADAQAKVPVDSSSLLNSGRSGTDVRDNGDTWIGYMAWGGESAPNYVDYAIYQMAEGGEQDWLRDSHEYNAALESVIERHIRAHLRR